MASLKLSLHSEEPLLLQSRECSPGKREMPQDERRHIWQGLSQQKLRGVSRACCWKARRTCVDASAACWLNSAQWKHVTSKTKRWSFKLEAECNSRTTQFHHLLKKQRPKKGETQRHLYNRQGAGPEKRGQCVTPLPSKIQAPTRSQRAVNSFRVWDTFYKVGMSLFCPKDSLQRTPVTESKQGGSSASCGLQRNQGKQGTSTFHIFKRHLEKKNS